MGFSAVAFTDSQSVDEVSPGAPTFLRVDQVDNRQWEVEVQLPSTDADDTELTGLAKLVLASAPMIGGDNPFLGLSMPEIQAMPGVVLQEVALTPADAGGTKVLSVGIVNLGGRQAFATAVSD